MWFNNTSELRAYLNVLRRDPTITPTNVAMQTANLLANPHNKDQLFDECATLMYFEVIGHALRQDECHLLALLMDEITTVDLIKKLPVFVETFNKVYSRHCSKNANNGHSENTSYRYGPPLENDPLCSWEIYNHLRNSVYYQKSL